MKTLTYCEFGQMHYIPDTSKCKVHIYLKVHFETEKQSE